MHLATFDDFRPLNGANLMPLPVSRLDHLRVVNEMRGHNVGDWWIYRSLQRMLDYSKLTAIPLDASDEAIDYVNAHCSHLVIAGGNCLYGDHLEKHLRREVLEALEIPIVMIGVGLQGAIDKPLCAPLSPGSVDILKLIAERAPIGVRGEHSLAMLDQVSDVWIVGCPTLFYKLDPDLHIDGIRMRRSAGFTWRSYLYDFPGGAAMQQAHARDLARQFGSLVVLPQGEDVELVSAALYNRGATHHEVLAFENGPAGFYETTRVPCSAWDLHAPLMFQHGGDDIARAAWFSYDTADMMAKLESLDFVTGCRLHGCLLAAAHGRPAAALTYDARTSELIKTIGLPGVRLDKPMDLDALDWSLFNARYAHLWRVMGEFFDRVGLKHLLTSGRTP